MDRYSSRYSMDRVLSIMASSQKMAREIWKKWPSFSVQDTKRVLIQTVRYL
jgi:hypothetical protein